jgi:hypothetical protein
MGQDRIVRHAQWRSPDRSSREMAELPPNPVKALKQTDDAFTNAFPTRIDPLCPGDWHTLAAWLTQFGGGEHDSEIDKFPIYTLHSCAQVSWTGATRAPLSVACNPKHG